MRRVSPGDHGRGRCGYLDVVRLYSSAKYRGVSTNYFCFTRAEKPGVLRDYLLPPVLWHGLISADTYPFNLTVQLIATYLNSTNIRFRQCSGGFIQLGAYLILLRRNRLHTERLGERAGALNHTSCVVFGIIKTFSF